MSDRQTIESVQAIMHEVFKYADIAAPLRGPPMTQDQSIPVRQAAAAQDTRIRDMLYALATPPPQPSVSEGSVPDGWRLERDDGGRTIWVCGRGHRVAVEFGEPLWMFCNAMLAAAPQPTTKKG